MSNQDSPHIKQKRREYCLERALEHSRNSRVPTSADLIELAAQFEEYIVNGKKTDDE